MNGTYSRSCDFFSVPHLHLTLVSKDDSHWLVVCPKVGISNLLTRIYFSNHHFNKPQRAVGCIDIANESLYTTHQWYYTYS